MPWGEGTGKDQNFELKIHKAKKKKTLTANHSRTYWQNKKDDCIIRKQWQSDSKKQSFVISLLPLLMVIASRCDFGNFIHRHTFRKMQQKETNKSEGGSKTRLRHMDCFLIDDTFENVINENVQTDKCVVVNCRNTGWLYS